VHRIAWVCARATLYPNALILTWIVPGSSCAVVTPALINFYVPNPLHRDAIDDIRNVVARVQSVEDAASDLSILLTGWKRFGVENAREQVK
jgi:hypothetical protein